MMESDLQFDVTVSKWRPQRLLIQEIAVLPLSE